MKSVGILTTANAFPVNYGAVLQGYALQKQLNNMGYDARIVRYIGFEWVPENNTLEDRLKWILKGGHLKDKFLQFINRPKRNMNRQIFNQFIEDYIIFDSPKSKSFAQLKENPPQFDGFICGSDQIWNPLIHYGKNDPGYFLDFVPKSKNRIAYAPSFGVSKLPESSLSDLSCYLEKFDAISVREKTGAELIKDITGKDVKVVVDPTLLLSSQKWNELVTIPQNIPTKYILVYKFGRVESTNLFIKEIAKKLNLPIIALPLSSTIWSDGYPIRFDAGPKEFIGLIKNATLVCTDSFHATVFSLLMHTPFLTFYRSMPVSSGNMNSRVEDLLNMVGLSNRLVTPDGKISYENLFNIDFESVEKAIELRRKESIDFLKEALED